jgi:hypothetical protein
MAKPIVTQVKATKPMSLADMQAELDRVRAENQQLKSAQATADGYRFVANGRSFMIKISQKQAMSIYGLGRFPFTVYKEQGIDLFSPDSVAHINQFIADNADKLADKPEKETSKSE